MKKIFLAFFLAPSLFAQISFQTATIDSGSATSNAIYVNGTQNEKNRGMEIRVIGIELPSTFLGDTVSFKAKQISGANTWYNVYNGGLRYALPSGASRFIALNADVFVGVDSLKILSGTVEAPDISTASTLISVKIQKRFIK